MTAYQALFVSDVHLSAERPAQVARCHAFLARAPAAPAVFILGDLFDLWLGDDDTRVPHPETEQALRALVDRGTAVHVMHGNHDLLLNDGFFARTGCTPLQDPSVITVDDTRVLLMHGDTLCTDDLAYQTYRAHVHHPDTQAGFLAQPLSARLAYAEGLRAQSKDYSATVDDAVMDVNAVAATMTQHDAQVLIHGHTHRPATHALSDGKTRIVLSDWYERDEVLAFNGSYVRGSLDALLGEQADG